MAKHKRLKVDKNQPGFYHVFTKVIQSRFLLVEEEDKQYFIALLNKLSKKFFVDIFSYTIMDNHFHVVLKIMKPKFVPMAEIERRFHKSHKKKLKFKPEMADKLVERWSDLSEFMHDLNRDFAVFMNKKYGNKGHFWARRFGNSILQDAAALLYCMAYVDLNPVRAKMVNSPLEYPFCSIYHVLYRGNKSYLVSLEYINDILDSSQIDIEEFPIETSVKFQMLPDKVKIPYLAYVCFTLTLIEQENERIYNNEDSLFKSLKKFSQGLIIGSPDFIAEIWNSIPNNYRKLSFNPIENLGFSSFK